MWATYCQNSIKVVVTVKHLQLRKQQLNMKFLCVVLSCILVSDLMHCQYFTYPSGVQVWMQQVNVAEVNEYGEEVPSLHNIELLTAIRLQNTLPSNTRNNDLRAISDLRPGNYAVSGKYCPDGVRAADGSCQKEDLDD